MNTITDFTTPPVLYNPTELLYIISAKPAYNDVERLMITGYNFSFYEKGNKLNYITCRYPVSTYVRDKRECYIQDCQINNEEAQNINVDGLYHHYYIGTSEKIVKDNKFKALLKEIEQLKENANILL